DGMAVGPGSIVRVPLGPREVSGIVWDTPTDKVDPKKLRPISHVFDCPPIDEASRRFVDWVANWTLAAPGMVARMFLRAPAAFDPEPPMEGIRWAGSEPDRMTDARRRVLELARDGMAWTRSGIARAAGVSPTVVNGLAEQGLFDPVDIPAPPVVAAPDPDYAQPSLSPDQRAAADSLIEKIGAGFSTTLLDGVTGSGKTEVYLEAIAEAVRRGKQVLVLVPEIALTAAFLERFHDRFGARPAEWHSD